MSVLTATDVCTRAISQYFLFTCKTGGMTNLIVLFVYCQLRFSVSIGELKTWRKKIENTIFEKHVLIKINFAPDRKSVV